MTKLNRLPTELFYMILTCLHEQNDIAALLFVCREINYKVNNCGDGEFTETDKISPLLISSGDAFIRRVDENSQLRKLMDEFPGINIQYVMDYELMSIDFPGNIIEYYEAYYRRLHSFDYDGHNILNNIAGIRPIRIYRGKYRVLQDYNERKHMDRKCHIDMEHEENVVFEYNVSTIDLFECKNITIKSGTDHVSIKNSSNIKIIGTHNVIVLKGCKNVFIEYAKKAIIYDNCSDIEYTKIDNIQKYGYIVNTV